MRWSKRWMVSCVVVVALCGCGNSSVKEMSKPAWYPKTANWPELGALMNNNNTPDPNSTTLEKMARSVFGGKTDVLCHPERGIASKNFQDKVKAFEAAPIPAEFATPERESSKKELLDRLKGLLAGCKAKKSSNAIAADFKKVLDLHKSIVEIPGQSRPTGAEGERYASEK